MRIKDLKIKLLEPAAYNRLPLFEVTYQDTTLQVRANAWDSDRFLDAMSAASWLRASAREGTSDESQAQA